jgi:hypothetical protein
MIWSTVGTVAERLASDGWRVDNSSRLSVNADNFIKSIVLLPPKMPGVNAVYAEFGAADLSLQSAATSSNRHGFQPARQN